MQKNEHSKIPCSVAFLTWNSDKYLRRTLDSVKDFGEIIFVDGGSTDETLKIAKEYGVKVVSQSNPGNPITDFARERQIGLEAAKYDWHLWLDSDDVVSTELASKINEIADNQNNDIYIYWIRMKRVNAETLKEYMTFFKTYQPRLCRKTADAHFVRAMHETIRYDSEVKTKRINEPWLVVVTDSSFDSQWSKQRAWKRVMTQFETSSTPLTFRRFLRKGVIRPMKLIIKHLIKLFLNKIFYGRNAMPAGYVLYKIYYQTVWIRIVWSKYFLGKFPKQCLEQL